MLLQYAQNERWMSNTINVPRPMMGNICIELYDGNAKENQHDQLAT